MIFWGLKFWSKVIFWGPMKDAGIFLGCEKGLRDFLGYSIKSSDLFG